MTAADVRRIVREEMSRLIREEEAAFRARLSPEVRDWVEETDGVGGPSER